MYFFVATPSTLFQKLFWNRYSRFAKAKYQRCGENNDLNDKKIWISGFIISLLNQNHRQPTFIRDIIQNIQSSPLNFIQLTSHWESQFLKWCLHAFSCFILRKTPKFILHIVKNGLRFVYYFQFKTIFHLLSTCFFG